MTKEKIDRINELYRLSKERDLTEEESAEQAALRREYVEDFKRSLMGQLSAIDVQNPDGSIEPLLKQ